MQAVAKRHDDPGRGQQTRHAPERTCVGCREREPSAGLLRFALVPEHEPPLVPDLAGRLGGRGAWVHARAACVVKAARGGFARAFKQPLRADPAQLLALARAQFARRAQGLLLAALRRRQVALGTDAVAEALNGSLTSTESARTGAAACRVRLLLVAKDAAGRRNELVARASERHVEVLELFDKAALGSLTGRQELGFVALLEAGIAREVADSARWLAGLSEDG
jgi:predicted RNA-binding protein YlxR (DUF448 family)